MLRGLEPNSNVRNRATENTCDCNRAGFASVERNTGPYPPQQYIEKDESCQKRVLHLSATPIAQIDADDDERQTQHALESPAADYIHMLRCNKHISAVHVERQAQKWRISSVQDLINN